MAPAPTATGPRWSRLSRDERREQILAAARRQFSRHPYSEVSTQAVADEVGVRRGLIHHHFGSKRVLYLAVVADLLDRAAPPVAPHERASAAPILDRATAAHHVDRWLSFVEAHAPVWLAVLGAEGTGRDPDVERLVDEARDRTVERIVAVLGIENPTVGVRAVLRAYSGLADRATHEWLVRGALSRDQARHLLTTTLLTLMTEVAPALGD